MLFTILSPEGRKALLALVASVVGYGVTIGLLDEGAAQTVGAVVATILTVISVFYARNETVR